jgi:diguanylate cyclase (GGDEF)-like protein
MVGRRTQRQRRPLRGWLACCCLLVACAAAVVPAVAPARGDGTGRQARADRAHGGAPSFGAGQAARGRRGGGSGKGHGLGRAGGSGGGNPGHGHGGGGGHHHGDAPEPGGGSGSGGGRPTGAGGGHHGGGVEHGNGSHGKHGTRQGHAAAGVGAVTGSGSPSGSVGAGRRPSPIAGVVPAQPATPQPAGAEPVPVPAGTAPPAPGAPPASTPAGTPVPQLTPGLEDRLAGGGALPAPLPSLAASAARAVPTLVPGAAIGVFGSAVSPSTPPRPGAAAGGARRAGGGGGSAGAGAPWASRLVGSALAAVPRGVWIALAALGVISVLLVGTTTAAAVASRRRGRALEEAAALGVVDSLTGLLMRGALEQRLAAEVGRARRYDRPLSLVFFDVRGLKAVNDLHGHGAGDRLLREVGALLVSSSRDHDVCGRIGGDEFVVVLPEDDGAGAETFRDRVYAALPQARYNIGLRTNWDLTSGVATFPADGETPRELLDTADRRLYQHRGIEIDPPGAAPS